MTKSLCSRNFGFQHQIFPAFCPIIDSGWKDSGIESRLRWHFSHKSGSALGPTQPPVRWALAAFPGLKAARPLTTHSRLVPMLKKAYSYTSTPQLGFLACSRTTLLLPVKFSSILFSWNFWVWNGFYFLRSRRWVVAFTPFGCVVAVSMSRSELKFLLLL